jgi:hypothetical protein
MSQDWRLPTRGSAHHQRWEAESQVCHSHRWPYGYPIGQAAPIALRTTMDFLQAHPEVELVRFVLFGQSAYDAYRKALEGLVPA